LGVHAPCAIKVPVWPLQRPAADTVGPVTGNEVVVRRFFDELWSGGNVAVADELLAPHHQHHISGGTLHGPGAVKAMVVGLRTSFPDLTFRLEDVINAEDTVVVRWTAFATYAGEDPPGANGRRVTWTGIDIVRLRDERIVELWGNNDSQGLAEQLEE
jgi:predicted ester cyclase